MIPNHLFYEERVFAFGVLSITDQLELCDVKSFTICSKLKIALIVVVFIYIINLVIVFEAFYFVLLKISNCRQHFIIIIIMNFHYCHRFLILILMSK